MMRNIRIYMLLMAALFVGVACEETKPDVEQPQDKGGFKIEIFDLHSSHCKAAMISRFGSSGIGERVIMYFGSAVL